MTARQSFLAAIEAELVTLHYELEEALAAHDELWVAAVQWSIKAIRDERTAQRRQLRSQIMNRGSR